jgi:hypothetical protein
LKQLREVWTKDFKSSPTEEDDVQEDDVEMTGEVSGEVSRVDEDPFETEMRLANETSAQEVRVSYVNPKALDQLEEWMKEKPIPYISNDKFSQEGIFRYWAERLPGHAHVNQTYPDVVRMWRQFHGCPASGGGIERVFFQLENSMMLSRKKQWTRPWKAH